MNVPAQALPTLPHFVHLIGASREDISGAEQALGVTFATDYSDYLNSYGVASANGHELTGLCRSARLNVVDVTREEREQTSSVDPSWYVIERVGIDSVVAWQSPDGKVHFTAPGIEAHTIASSLVEYLAR